MEFAVNAASWVVGKALSPVVDGFLRRGRPAMDSATTWKPSSCSCSMRRPSLKAPSAGRYTALR
ncbi:hypothetical protein EJB05_20727, partial [Eragrostis curvula]